LEKVIYPLEWARVEEFVESGGCGGIGRPPHERGRPANALVAEPWLSTVVVWIERPKMDRALRRIRGFVLCGKLPSKATFSRVFEEFVRAHPAQVHEVSVQ
jgi:hypothetical protein